MAVLEILEAASGVASKTLFEKIDFVITDQTAHNFHVDELVAESLESEHIPDHLLRNVHPTLMFNRVISKQWAEIENTLGRYKIYSNFLVTLIPEIMLAWNIKQEELKKQDLQDKEIANVAVDRRRNKDLDTLKGMGGPFTSAAAVEEYVAATDIDERTKVGRLYLEVRYARDTSLSLPKASDLFRLMKDHKSSP